MSHRHSSSLPTPLAAAWPKSEGLHHGFFGRLGGVSQGPFAALNLSSRVGDRPEDVRTNWNLAQAAAGHRGKVVRIHQVHGDTVLDATEVGADEPQADAVMTRAKGVLLTILTADCVPLLVSDHRGGAVAAVHAGWRGTVAGVTVRTVRAMGDAFGCRASDLRVAMGPSIGGCCYEVSEEVVASLEERWGSMPQAVHRAPGAKPRLDLRIVNRLLLEREGVHEIANVGPCSRCASHTFFSHRQATQEGSGVTGRQLSYIGWSD